MMNQYTTGTCSKINNPDADGHSLMVHAGVNDHIRKIGGFRGPPTSSMQACKVTHTGQPSPVCLLRVCGLDKSVRCHARN